MRVDNFGSRHFFFLLVFAILVMTQKVMHQSNVLHQIFIVKITGMALTFTSHNLIGKEMIISHLCAALQTDFCKPAGHFGTQSNFFL